MRKSFENSKILCTFAPAIDKRVDVILKIVGFGALVQ